MAAAGGARDGHTQHSSLPIFRWSWLQNIQCVEEKKTVRHRPVIFQRFLTAKRFRFPQIQRMHNHPPPPHLSARAHTHKLHKDWKGVIRIGLDVSVHAFSSSGTIVVEGLGVIIFFGHYTLPVRLLYTDSFCHLRGNKHLHIHRKDITTQILPRLRWNFTLLHIEWPGVFAHSLHRIVAMLVF
jgi:hypothetical protein